MKKTKKALEKIKEEILNEAFKLDNRQSKIIFKYDKKVKLKKASNKLYNSANKIDKIINLLYK